MHNVPRQLIRGHYFLFESVRPASSSVRMVLVKKVISPFFLEKKSCIYCLGISYVCTPARFAVTRCSTHSVRAHGILIQGTRSRYPEYYEEKIEMYSIRDVHVSSSRVTDYFCHPVSSNIYFYVFNGKTTTRSSCTCTIFVCHSAEIASIA